MIADPDLPAAALLLGEEAKALLAAAMEAAGERLHTARPSQVRYRPGRSIVVSYRAELDRRPGGMPAIATLVAMSGGSIPEGALTLERDDVSAGVWRYPNDPVLPGLRHVVDAGRRAALFADLALNAEITGLRTRSYRPTRRAVVELKTTAGRFFAKVVRPHSLPALLARYEAAAEHGMAPPVVAHSPELGVLMTGEMQGDVLRDLLDGDDPLPDPDALAALLDRLPQVEGTAAGLVERLPDHARLLAAIRPDLGSMLDALREVVGSAGSGDAVPVHGDFHPGQVVIRHGKVAGLLDVDTLGVGRRTDDLANMLAFLHAREADGHEAVHPYRERLEAGFAAPGLRAATAAAVAGFATMPFVAQRPGWPMAVTRRVERAVALASAGG